MSNRPTQTFSIPTGEQKVSLKPSASAWVIDGYEPESEGSLRTLYGMAPWDPHAPVGAQVYSLFRCDLQGRDFLLSHEGLHLQRHKGWYRTWNSLIQVGVIQDPIYREQYVTVGGRIIWTDGCGSMSPILDIYADELVTELGFQVAPSTPSVDGPTTSSASDRALHLPNSTGYSVPGRIGTVGDALSETSAKLLAGTWTYWAQWESIAGDMSPLSPASPSISVASQWTDPTVYAGATYTQADVDDLLRSYTVAVSGDNAPDHVRAVWIYRSPDSRNDSRGSTPLFLARIPGSARVMLPDDAPDSHLGQPARVVRPVPAGRIITAHQGRLITANTPDAEDTVYLSEPGNPGTFAIDSWVTVPGGKVTGLASYGGRLIAWSPTGTFEITDGLVQPITLTSGCLSPTSVQVTTWGLMWLGQDGVYLMAADGSVSKASAGLEEIISYEVARNRLHLAMSAVDEAGYRLVLPTSGTGRFDLMLTYSPDAGWRRFSFAKFGTIGIMNPEVTAITSGPDGSLLLGILYWVLGGGGVLTATHTVMVWDRQMYGSTWTMTSQYISSWLTADEHGAVTFRVRKLYVRLLDSSDSSINVTFQVDGVETTAGDTQALRLTSPMFELEGYEHLDAVVIGTDKARRDAPYWRYVACPPELSSVRSFRFVLDGAAGQDIRLAGFAFDVEVISGDQYGRIPGGEE